MRQRENGIRKYSIKKNIWRSQIWKEAKVIFKDLNILIYGVLTCEMCHKGFYSEKLSSFQLHHDILLYNWEKVFNPKTTHLVHKGCHLKHLNITNKMY